MKKNRPPAYYLRRLGVYIAIAIFGSTSPVVAVEFNVDILDSEDRENIDLSRFSRAGYIMPGTYTLSMRLTIMGFPIRISLSLKELATINWLLKPA